MSVVPLRVAMIGCGFMGRAHSNAFRQVDAFFPDPACRVVRQVVVGTSEAKARAAAEQQGWAEWSTDLASVLARPDIDLVDVATPNDSHYAVAMAAIAAGKDVLCEKPLALTVAQAREMAEAARRRGVRTLVWHNYRRAPAATTAAQLIAEGALGEIRHVRAVYLQDWLADESCPHLWRMSAGQAGSGAHGDLNAHLIDMTRFLTSLEFAEVCGMQETFIRQRRTPDGGSAPVDVDDAFLFLARLSNGALASFEATRAAPGRKNYNRIEVNGTRGSLVWNFERMNELEFYDAADQGRVAGFRTIMCMNNAAHPYAGHYWPDGHVIGYEHTFVNALADFIAARRQGLEFRPGFADAVAVQEVLEAAQVSARGRCWTTVERSQSFNGPAVRPAATRTHTGLSS
jgi:predicted dehydrogenase